MLVIVRRKNDSFVADKHICFYNGYGLSRRGRHAVFDVYEREGGKHTKFVTSYQLLKGESVSFDRCKITIGEIRENKVDFIVDAPRDCPVYRTECGRSD